jgi:hypothetical protein
MTTIKNNFNFKELKEIINKEMKKIEKINLGTTSEELAELHYILDTKYNINIEEYQEMIDKSINELYNINIY